MYSHLTDLDKWLVLNQIMSIMYKYLKPFTCMQTNKLWLI